MNDGGEQYGGGKTNLNEDDKFYSLGFFFRCGRVSPNNPRNGNWFLNDKVVGRRGEKEMGIVELCGLPRCFLQKVWRNWTVVYKKKL